MDAMSIVTPIRNPHADRLEMERWRKRAEALEGQLKDQGIEPTNIVAAPVAARVAPINGGPNAAIEQGQFGCCFVQMFRNQVPPGSRALQFASALNSRLGTNKAAQAQKTLPQRRDEEVKILPVQTRQGETPEVDEASLRYAMIELT
jgi:hypothetical protein